MSTELYLLRCNRCGALYGCLPPEESPEDKRLADSITENPCRVCERGKGFVEPLGKLVIQC